MNRLALLLAAVLCGCPAEDPPVGTLCEPGRDRCDSNSYERCADDGARWVQVADCSSTDEVCVANSGCLHCFPGRIECGGESGFDVVRCRDDGSMKDPIASCDPEI